MHSRAGFQAETAYVTFLGFLGLWERGKNVLSVLPVPPHLPKPGLASKNRPVKWAMGGGGTPVHPALLWGGGRGVCYAGFAYEATLEED
jgi:hypothetical protein